MHKKLPRDPKELDTFVEEISAHYDLPRNDETYDAIATKMLHMPTETYSAILKDPSPAAFFDYFGYGVLKMMANTAAWFKCEEFRQKRDEKIKKIEDEKKAADEKSKLSLVQKEELPIESKPIQNA